MKFRRCSFIIKYLGEHTIDSVAFSLSNSNTVLWLRPVIAIASCDVISSPYSAQIDLKYEYNFFSFSCVRIEENDAFTLGVGNEGRHQLQDVLFTLDVGKGIVVHGFTEVDSIEDLDLVAFPQEKLSAFHHDAALGVGDHIAGVTLHEIWFEPKPRFTRSGTAHHHDILVACEPWVLGPVVHGQALRLR